jgi:Lrp/AsnC family leucine-responsive transcriptional regulator
MIEIDKIDRQILRALVKNSSQNASTLGRTLGLSQPAAWRRIKRLQDTGVLIGQRVPVDAAALGFGVTVFLGIKLATKGRVSLEDFERAVASIPEVQVVQHFERILRRRIMTLPGAGQVEANVLLTQERGPGPI